MDRLLGKVLYYNSNCLEDAEQTRETVRERFLYIGGDITTFDIGTMIASHCVPGTVAVFFLGNESIPYHTA